MRDFRKEVGCDMHVALCAPFRCTFADPATGLSTCHILRPRTQRSRSPPRRQPTCTASLNVEPCLPRTGLFHNRQCRRRHQLLGPQRQKQGQHAASSRAGPAGSSRSTAEAVKEFVLDQFLPLGLLVAMLVGYLAPASGLAAARLGLGPYTTSGIFVIQGLNLRRGEALKALSSWGATLYGCIAILFVTPLLALLALRLPLAPPEFAFGLAVFCCMPTTLSSGVSLTQAVGGNTALALLLTVGTNLAAILTMPFMLAALLGASTSGVTLDPAALLASLLRTILLPLLAGAAARASSPVVRGWVDGHRKALTLLSACLLITVPWIQISRGVTSGVVIRLSQLAAVVAAGVALHLIYLAFNLSAVNLLNIGGGTGPEAAGIERAVVLVASQKTLPVAVTVLSQLPGSAVGLAVIPCVAAHMSQIVFDSFLVSWWLKSDQAAQQQNAKLA